VPAGASGAVHTLNFDGSPPGTVVSGGPGGMGLDGGPVVFGAGSNATSPPNGLRRTGDCPVPPSGGMFGQCPSGDNRLEMTFSSPARTVTLRAGIPATGPCFEVDCPQARLVGFNAAGDVVALTPITDVFSTNMNGNTGLGMDAGSHVITRAVLAVGEDPAGSATYMGYRHTAQIDDLRYDVLESGDPPPPPAPSAPRITITDPSRGQSFASTDVTVSGLIVASAGVADACILANAPPDFPVECRRRFAQRPDGSFSAGLIPGMRPGANEISVWVRDRLGRVARDTVTVRVVDGDVDYAVETMELTQAVQTKALPTADEMIDVPGLPVARVPGDTYDGVPLALGKQTAVRLYGEARGASTPVRGVPAVLHAYRRSGGRLVEFPGSPLRPTGNPAAVAAEADVPSMRAAAAGAWTFVLPSDWPRDANLVLVGEIAPGATVRPARDCCASNNFFGLRGADFTFVRSAIVYPIALEVTPPGGGAASSPPTPLRDHYSGLVQVWPGPMTIGPPLPAFDVTGIPNGLDGINARLRERFRNAGINGKVSGLLAGGGGGSGPGPVSATASADRKLDLVAHEVGHSLNLAHAMSGEACTNPNGGDIGPVAERGTMNGVGIDPGIWSSGVPGHFKPIAAEEAGVFNATPDAPNFVYDYMSYCSQETSGKTWVSVGYWANTLRELRPSGRVITGFTEGCCSLGAAADPTVRARRPVRAAQAQPTVTVSAALRPGDNRILNVETRRDPPTAALPGSDVEVVVRDRSGAEVSRTPVPATPLEARPGPGEPEPVPGRLVTAVVPGANAAGVEIVVGGVVVASRSASPSAPVVDLQRPGAGARIGSRGGLRIAWSATDPDGDALVSTVEFSPNGGRTWKPLGIVPAGVTSLRVPRAQLPRARRGELRVTVADGFNAASDSARNLRTAGAPPAVRIVSPPGGTRVRADTNVVLDGTAFDDAGKPIAGKRLRWSSGKRRLGRGARVDADVHELGRTITLRARDSAGRVGTARIRLRIDRVAPFFTALTAKRLVRGSRAIKLRVGTSMPGRLVGSTAGARTTRARVALEQRTVTIPIKGAARRSYRLKLRLSAGGKRLTQPFVVRRAR
jgi:hypothetical protein